MIDWLNLPSCPLRQSDVEQKSSMPTNLNPSALNFPVFENIERVQSVQMCDKKKFKEKKTNDSSLLKEYITFNLP